MKTIFDTRRPFGRLLFFLISLLVAMLTARLNAQGPQTTQVADIVYRSDGTPAHGTVLISWPNFTTADNKAVAAGRLSIALGAGGGLSVGLVPNAGADPAGTYYKVTYQLDDGSNSEEFWSVPATGPTTIAAIRSRVVPSGVALQVVSRQYVDDQLALKATDSNVVHKAGAEAIAGAKTFTVSPTVPTPVGSTDAANKAYVDANSGGGGGGGADDSSINVIADCGAVGNGTTDDYPAIAACIAANPGRHFIFPKRSAATQDGFSVTNADYYLSGRLVLDYNGSWLDGANPANAGGGVMLQFAAGVGGIRCTPNANNCKLSNLMLVGANTYSSASRTTYPDWRGTEAALLQGDGVDGIQVMGLGARLENVLVQGFARHGIYISGDSTILPDSNPGFWYLDRVTVNANSGDGIYVNGGNAAGGVGVMVDARGNGIYGVQDNTTLGNTWVGVGTHRNHNNFLAAGGTQALTSASVTSNVMTLTTSAALANGVDTAGTWVTTAGQSDPSFNTTCKVLTVNTGTKQLTCAFTHANGSTSGGTVGQSSTASVYNAWSAAGINGGCIGGTGQQQTWIGPYMEADQGIAFHCVNLAATNNIYGGNGDPETFVDPTNPSQSNWMKGGTMYGSSFAFQNPTENQFLLTFKAGIASDQSELLRFFNRSLSMRAQIGWFSGDYVGMSDEVDGYVSIFKAMGGNVGIRGTSPTEDVEINKAIGRKFIIYGGDSTPDMTVDNAGLTTPAPITSTLPTGTAPFAVTSTTPVANLALAADTQLPTIATAGKVSDSALSSNVERRTSKNAANGYAGLDAGAKFAASQLPNPSASTLGGVQSKTCTGTDKFSAIGTDGVPVCSADQGGAGGGDSITVNGAAATDADFDDAAPAAPAGSVNVRWQKDAATPNNLSANVPFGYGLTAASSSLAVSLTTCEAYRSADLTLTATVYADNVSCSLAAGTWLITSETTVKSPIATAQKVTVKLWDGTTVYGAGEAAAPSQGAGFTGYVHIAVSKIVTLASTTTVKTSVASNAASIIDATPDDNGTGLANTANAIHAVRIGN